MIKLNFVRLVCIIKKELQLYFNSPIAYIVISLFLLISGFFFSRPIFVQNVATIRHYVELLPLFFLFFIPAITMKIYSEEYKTGTIEIIYTLPFSKFEVVIGKYLASLIVILVGIIITVGYPLSLLFLGKLDIGTTFASYIGIFLLAMMYTSVGLLGSSLTKNQIVSFILSFSILFIFFVIGKLGIFLPSIITYAGIDFHYENFVRGIIDIRDVTYFFSLTLMFLYITYQLITKPR